MYRHSAHHYNSEDPYRPRDGHGMGLVGGMGRGEEDGGYAPVDPFKASLAQGIKKVFGSARDRTIDDVPVARTPREAPIIVPHSGPYAYQPPASYLDEHALRPYHGNDHDLPRPYEPPIAYPGPPRGRHRHKKSSHRPPFPPLNSGQLDNFPPAMHGDRSRDSRSESRERRRARSSGLEYTGNLDTGYPSMTPYQQGPPSDVPWMAPPPLPPTPLIPDPGDGFGIPRRYPPIVSTGSGWRGSQSRSRSPPGRRVGVAHHLRAARQSRPSTVTMLPPAVAPTLSVHSDAPVVPVAVPSHSRSYSPDFPMSRPEISPVAIPPAPLVQPPSPAPVIIQQPHFHEVRRGRSPALSLQQELLSMQPAVIIQPRPCSRSPDPMRPVAPHSQPVLPGRQGRTKSSLSEGSIESVSPPHHDPMTTLPPAWYNPPPRKESKKWEHPIYPVFAAEPYYSPADAQPYGQAVPLRRRYSGRYTGSMVIEFTWFTAVLSLLLDVIPRQVYLHLLLRFPSLYFSRVSRIFQDANLGMGEIKRMALEAIEQDKAKEGVNQKLLYQGVFPQDWHSGGGCQPLSYMNLRNSWQAFIDSLMREWKTLNIVSVLLLSAILTILQIESAAANPLTRFSALLSLICAFMSLIYGCLYIIRFGTMRKTHKAAEWANESEKTSTSIFWNVWVMLSMPAVWLGWSMIFYIICIMSFVWQTGTVSQPRDYLPNDLEILIPRIVISCVLTLGFVYLVLVVATFSRYSDPMEQAWQARIRGWLQEKTFGASGHYPSFSHPRGPPMGTEQRHAYDAGRPNLSGGTREKSKARHFGAQHSSQVRPSDLYASLPPHETNSREPPKPRSMPNFASTYRTAPRSPNWVQKVGGKHSHAKKAKAEKWDSLDSTTPGPHGDAFISGLRAPGTLEGQTGLVPTVHPIPIHPPRSIVNRDMVNAPSASYGMQELEEDLARVDTPDSEHPSQYGSDREGEVTANRMSSVVAVPLRYAPTINGKSVAFEEMEEICKFDLGVKEVQHSEGSVGNGFEESRASTSRISGTSIPLPRQLLEKGLAVPIWERFCKDIFAAWREAEVNSNALAKLVEVVEEWNDYLDPLDVFLALVQFDDTAEYDTAQERISPSSYSLYLGPKGLVRVGVRTPGSGYRLSRLALEGSSVRFQMHKSVFPEMIAVVDEHDTPIKLSDGVGDGENRTVEDGE